MPDTIATLLNYGITLGAISCVVMFFITLVNFIYAKRSVKRIYSEELERLTRLHSDYQKRFSVLNEHIEDYLLSVSPEGMRALEELRYIDCTLKAIIDDLETLLQHEQNRVVEEVLLFLSNRAKSLSTGVPEPLRAHVINLQHWDSRFEDLLQCIGHDIAEASKSMEQLVVRKQRRRKQTSVSLREARIYLVE